jgi:outer membrane protein assembly factor BamE (lipoprotein component of BamABCDE complex)
MRRHRRTNLKDSRVSLTSTAKLASALAFAALLPGCAIFGDAQHYRGNAVSAHDLGELTPGTSSQADVAALLGPPTFQEMFQPNNWVYVAQVTKMRIGQTEGVKQQHVVVLIFDNSGTLQKISEEDLKNSIQVAMDGQQTPVPGGKAGFVQQLVGGVGSYNPLGGTGLGGGGNTAGAGGLGGGGLGGGGLGGGGGGF